jgi:hypothetical protein
MKIICLLQYTVRFIGQSERDNTCTGRQLYLKIRSPAKCYTERRIGPSHHDSFSVPTAIVRQTDLVDAISIRIAASGPMLLCVSFFLIWVNKLLHMIFQWWIGKDGTCHAKVIEFICSAMTTNELNIVWSSTVKWESKNKITAEGWWHNLHGWCFMTNQRSHWWSIQICLNHEWHAAFIHVVI